ncbi:MAG: hypothetical protein SangKO_100110 [Sandaracinaceae bacterium]
MWKVIVDYDASRPLDEQDAVDTTLDRLADEAGEVVESGAGSGFGRRDLDYAFETEAEAVCLAESVEAAFADRPGLDLTVRAVSLDETFDA